MSNLKCSQCGAPVEVNRTDCKYCGGKYNLPPQPHPPQDNTQIPTAQQSQPRMANTVPNQTLAPGIDPSWPIKSKGVAAFLAFFFGTFGLHKFYLGRPLLGILYLVFFWSGAPTLIGILEGAVYLLQREHNFQVRNKVRIN